MLVLFILLALLTGCNENKATYVSISTDKAVEMMETESDYIILDVRTVMSIFSHIKTINYPNENINDAVLTY